MQNIASALNVTVLQSDLKWENKKANLESFEQKIFACEDKMEIVLLPEMFSTGFSMRPTELGETMDGETVQWMKRVAAEKKIVLGGSVIIKENDLYYNRFVWMLPNGEYGVYDKRHLFGYAGEDLEYTRGNKRLIASIKGWRIHLLVCYDLRFPVWARQSIPKEGTFERPEYDVLVYVANWPEKRVHAWRTLLQARAIENQCYVVGVNRVGIDGNGHQYPGESMVIDALGSPVYKASDKEEVFTCTLEYDKLEEVRERLPFLGDADPFIIVG